MAYSKLTKRNATATTPQVVTLIVDDSGSMQGNKADMATQAVTDMVITMQTGNLGTSWSRFILSIARFGNDVVPIAEASKPEEVNLQFLNFQGNGGATNMPAALQWGTRVTQQAINRCRQEAPHYDEAGSPPPLVVFFSDGANTHDDPIPFAQSLRAIDFKGGPIDLVSCGIGMSADSMRVMEVIASRPDLAVNIDPEMLGEFIAAVGATAVDGAGIDSLVRKGTQMEYGSPGKRTEARKFF